MHRFACTLVALSAITPFFSALFTAAPAPTVIDIVFGFFPFVALGALTLFVAFVWFGRMRSAHAVEEVIQMLLRACVVVILLSLVGVWNDGSYHSVVSPSQALEAMFTVGVLPLHVGPNVLIRFLPLLCAVGVWLRLRRISLPRFQLWRAVGYVYFFQSIFLYALSWVAAALGAVAGSIPHTAEGAFRLLVRAQADGFWTRGQLERFFAPLSQQSENSLLAIHASIVFFAMMTLIVVVVAKQSRSIQVFVRYHAKRGENLLFGAVVLIGFGIGRAANNFSFSYTNVIAGFVFLFVLLLWSAWWRLRRKRTEGVSGASETVSTRMSPMQAVWGDLCARDELAGLSMLALFLALFGSFLLGWQVFLAISVATMMVWIFEGYGTYSPYARPATSYVLSLLLGWAAMTVGLRDMMPSAWMVRILLCASILIAVTQIIRNVQIQSYSHFQRGVIIAIGIAIALFFARQSVFWMLFLPCLAALCIFSSSRVRESWHTYQERVAHSLIAIITLIVFFAPHLLVHR